ncbi:MAG: hypothetical protein Ct9H300mP23_11060 [Nitrospinota bacterium]|nr:MAG: hypothetical protein Ct9H300mP23_11060 [Nitrospinota bacterium]
MLFKQFRTEFRLGKERFLNCTNKQRVQTTNSPKLKLNARVLIFANKTLSKEKAGILNLIQNNQSTLQERERTHQSNINELQQLKEQQEKLKQKVLECSNQAQEQAEAPGERKEGPTLIRLHC